MAVQGHPIKVIDFDTSRKRACDSCSWSIVVLVLSYIHCEIRRFIGWKSQIFPNLLSYNVVARSKPFRICGWTLYRQDCSQCGHIVLHRFATIPARHRPRDGWIDRRANISTVVATGLCIASYADGMLWKRRVLHDSRRCYTSNVRVLNYQLKVRAVNDAGEHRPSGRLGFYLIIRYSGVTKGDRGHGCVSPVVAGNFFKV